MASRTARNRFKVAAALALIIAGALAGPAAARSPDEKRWRKACTADAFAQCPLQALSGNRNGVRDCLLKRMDKLSDPCVAVIHEAQQQSLALSAAAAPQQAIAVSATLATH